MSDWERLAGLELEIEDYSLEPLQASVSSSFERKSTVIHLRGAGEGLSWPRGQQKCGLRSQIELRRRLTSAGPLW